MAHVNLTGLMLGRFDQIRIELLSWNHKVALPDLPWSFIAVYRKIFSFALVGTEARNKRFSSGPQDWSGRTSLFNLRSECPSTIDGQFMNHTFHMSLLFTLFTCQVNRSYTELYNLPTCYAMPAITCGTDTWAVKASPS